ncbi:MAG: hypothetical protein ACON5B_16140 [Myxococcota bacterium]
MIAIRPMLIGCLLATHIVPVGGCSSAPSEPVTPEPEVTFTGRYEGSFEMSEVKLGGVLPLAAHPVELKITLSQSDADLKGMGSATNLLGDLAALAFVTGAQRGDIKGMVVDGVAELSLDIPPFGAPPAPASIVFVGTVTENGLSGQCRSSVAGDESTPAPCTLSRVKADAALTGQ